MIGNCIFFFLLDCWTDDTKHSSLQILSQVKMYRVEEFGAIRKQMTFLIGKSSVAEELGEMFQNLIAQL